jgi:prepilin-type N-terminal cleavage/methylation domain-containing protein
VIIYQRYFFNVGGKKLREKKSHKGFTLAEVVLSVGIMGVIILLISSVFISGLYNIKKSKYKIAALNIADKKLTELKNLPLCDNTIPVSDINSSIYGTDFVTGALTWGSSSPDITVQGNENINNIPYRYTIKISEYNDNPPDDPNNIKKVNIEVKWKDPQGGDKSIRTITLIARPKKTY